MDKKEFENLSESELRQLKDSIDDVLEEKRYKESYLKNLTKECFTKGYLTNSVKGVAGGNLTTKSLKFLNSL